MSLSLSDIVFRKGKATKMMAESENKSHRKKFLQAVKQKK
jgi:hypothetical protein